MHRETDNIKALPIQREVTKQKLPDTAQLLLPLHYTWTPPKEEYILFHYC